MGKIIDEAIQVHGAHGVSQDCELSEMWRQQRTLRIADGPDQVHLMTVAKRELANLASGGNGLGRRISGTNANVEKYGKFSHVEGCALLEGSWHSCEDVMEFRLWFDWQPIAPRSGCEVHSVSCFWAGRSRHVQRPESKWWPPDEYIFERMLAPGALCYLGPVPPTPAGGLDFFCVAATTGARRRVVLFIAAS